MRTVAAPTSPQRRALAALRGLDEPRAVAVARVGLGLAALLNTYEMHLLLMRLAAGDLLMPFASTVPSPTEPAVWAVTALGAVTALAITVGWRSAPMALLAVIVNLWIFAWDQQTFSNHRHLVTLLLLFLAGTRPDRVWAVRRTPVGAPAPWFQLFMMVQLSVLYLFAALSKINLTFPSGVQFDHWLWLELPAQLDMAMAWGTIIGELIMAVGLWFARTRTLAMTLGVLLHGSIVVLMNHDNLVLLAFACACICLYPLFSVWGDQTTQDGDASGRR